MRDADQGLLYKIFWIFSFSPLFHSGFTVPPPQCLYQSCLDLTISSVLLLVCQCPPGLSSPDFKFVLHCASAPIFLSFITNPVLISAHRLFIYVQSRWCRLPLGQVEPTHLWNCYELKLYLDARKLLLPPRKCLHLLLLHHVSLLQGDPCCSCTAGSGQRVKSRISGSQCVTVHHHFTHNKMKLYAAEAELLQGKNVE